jgi:hypothetical protein
LYFLTVVFQSRVCQVGEFDPQVRSCPTREERKKDRHRHPQQLLLEEVKVSNFTKNSYGYDISRGWGCPPKLFPNTETVFANILMISWSFLEQLLVENC